MRNKCLISQVKTQSHLLLSASSEHCFTNPCIWRHVSWEKNLIFTKCSHFTREPLAYTACEKHWDCKFAGWQAIGNRLNFWLKINMVIFLKVWEYTLTLLARSTPLQEVKGNAESFPTCSHWRQHLDNPSLPSTACVGYEKIQFPKKS